MPAASAPQGAQPKAPNTCGALARAGSKSAGVQRSKPRSAGGRSAEKLASLITRRRRPCCPSTTSSTQAAAWLPSLRAHSASSLRPACTRPVTSCSPCVHHSPCSSASAPLTNTRTWLSAAARSTARRGSCASSKLRVKQATSWSGVSALAQIHCGAAPSKRGGLSCAGALAAARAGTCANALRSEAASSRRWKPLNSTCIGSPACNWSASSPSARRRLASSSTTATMSWPLSESSIASPQARTT
jgi:hypothetical protein